MTTRVEMKQFWKEISSSCLLLETRKREESILVVKQQVARARLGFMCWGWGSSPYSLFSCHHHPVSEAFFDRPCSALISTWYLLLRSLRIGTGGIFTSMAKSFQGLSFDEG